MPSFTDIHTYRSVYALSTVSKKGNVLKATHYCACIIHGSHPTWSVWTVGGKHIMFGTRSHIERAYPKLVWKRVMLRWSLDGNQDYTAVEKRKNEIEENYPYKFPESKK